MHTDDIRIEKLRREEHEKVAIILTDAFVDNPAYTLIFAGKDNLQAGLMWLFKTNLFLINRRATVTRVVKENKSGEIIGTFSLLPPGGVESKMYDYMHIGLPRFLSQYGFGTLRKMLGMDSYNKQLLTDAIGTDKYYYLSMVALKEECRGTGIGSFMITSCLDELRASPTKKCNLIGLTTQLPENVIFYTRLGFRKLDEGEVSFGGDGYYNYDMGMEV